MDSLSQLSQQVELRRSRQSRNRGQSSINNWLVSQAPAQSQENTTEQNEQLEQSSAGTDAGLDNDPFETDGNSRDILLEIRRDLKRVNKKN